MHSFDSVSGKELAVLRQSPTVNFQVTVLKVLVSYPEGFALLADLKRDVALLATSGRDWSNRTKRLAARVPGLDIFSQRLVDRIDGGWKITDQGRSVLELMEARTALEASPSPVEEPAEPKRIQVVGSAPAHPLALRNERRQVRRRQRRNAVTKASSPAREGLIS